MCRSAARTPKAANVRADDASLDRQCSYTTRMDFQHAGLVAVPDLTPGFNKACLALNVLFFSLSTCLLNCRNPKDFEENNKKKSVSVSFYNLNRSPKTQWDGLRTQPQPEHF